MKTLGQLKAELDAANAAVSKLTRKLGPAVIKTPEYKAAKQAYRAYWVAYDSQQKKV